MFGLIKYSGGGSGGGNVTTSGMSAGTLPIATAPTNIENSTLTYVPLPAPANYLMPPDNRLTFGGVVSASSGVPLITPGPSLGLGGTATLLRGNDFAGLVQCTFGNAGLVPGTIFTLTFLHAYPGQLKAICISNGTGYSTAQSNKAQPFALQDIASAGTGFDVKCENMTGFNLQTFTYSYIVIG